VFHDSFKALESSSFGVGAQNDSVESSL